MFSNIVLFNKDVLPPTDITISGTTDVQSVITWTASTGATGYTITYWNTATPATTTTTTTITTTTYTLTGLTGGSVYNFYIKATSNSGGSYPSSSNTISTNLYVWCLGTE